MWKLLSRNAWKCSQRNFCLSFTARARAAVTRQPPLSEPLNGFENPKYVDPKSVELFATTCSTLPNGLRVATEPVFGEFCTLGVAIDAGMRYEARHPQGISHYLEKLAFMRSENYENKDILEKIGSLIDCQSTRSCPKKSIEKVTDIITDAVQRPVFTEIFLNLNGTSMILPNAGDGRPRWMPSYSPAIAVEAPADRIVEKFDPTGFLVPVSAPSSDRARAPMYAGVRMLVIRRKKMLKFKRKKRMKRDRFLLEKLRIKKELKAEALFQARMRELLQDLKDFDPLKYVKDVIKSAERKWEVRLAPTGRKKHRHWSELMSLEELYGIPHSEYIDKRAGLINAPEERAKFAQRRADYFAKYVRKMAPISGPKDGK